LTPGRKTRKLTQGGRARTPAPLIGKKEWRATMRHIPNVLRAMQSIQVDIEEAQVKLAESEGKTQNDIDRLEACTDILRRTWRTANDYETAFPQIILKGPASENDVG